MALIPCPECTSEVSDKAPLCPSCGVRLRRRKRWPWLAAGGFVVLAGLAVGGFVWADARAEAAALAEAEAARDASWRAALTSATSETADGVLVQPAADAGSVRIMSAALESCTQAELQELINELVAADVERYGVDVAALRYRDTTRDAPEKCDAGKQAAFDVSVSNTFAATVGLLSSLGSQDSAAQQLDGLRGLDGTRTADAMTDAGPITIQATFDGSNGLAVVVARGGSDEN